MISWRAISAVLRRPGLWAESVRALFAMAPVGWWRRPPFVPIPDGTLVRWRAQTAYGSASQPVTGPDLISYLEWRRRQRGPGARF